VRNRLLRGFLLLALVGVTGVGMLWPGGIAQAGPFEEGLNFFGGGHYRWALEKFVQAVDQSPSDPQPWWYLAESYRVLGDTEAAVTTYRHVLRMAAQSQFGVAARQTLEALGEPSAATVSVPFQRRGTAVVLPARINGEEVGAFLLDTGATFISVSHATAQRLGIRSNGNARVHLVTASGVIEAPLAILEEVDVGGAIARYVPAVIHDLPGMPSNVVGLLGMSFLERFQVNLDLTSGSLTLQSGK
jgi:clan AA aspartic protease (TIGR02281 family)